MSLDFVAIDFETANGKRSSPCAVGMTKVRDGLIVDRLAGYIQPPPPYDYFSAANVAVHGITARHVRNAPEWPKALAAITRFVGDDMMVAHNSSFEASVIRQSCELLALPTPAIPLACSLAIARSILWDLDKHRLPDVARAVGVPIGTHHDAQADADMSALAVVAMARQNGCTSLDSLLQMTAIQARFLA